MIGSGVSIEMVDCRMAMQPLLSWAQPISVGNNTQPTFGAIEEVDLFTNASECRGESRIIRFMTYYLSHVYIDHDNVFIFVVH